MINRAAIMARAWAIFRQTYNHPAIPFRSIGRKCFGWALRVAWWEAKKAARIAAISPVAKAQCAEALRSELAFLTYREDSRAACVRQREIENELAALAA
jgi:hypothetical protein